MPQILTFVLVLGIVAASSRADTGAGQPGKPGGLGVGGSGGNGGNTGLGGGSPGAPGGSLSGVGGNGGNGGFGGGAPGAPGGSPGMPGFSSPDITEEFGSADLVDGYDHNFSALDFAPIFNSALSPVAGGVQPPLLGRSKFSLDGECMNVPGLKQILRSDFIKTKREWKAYLVKLVKEGYRPCALSLAMQILIKAAAVQRSA